MEYRELYEGTSFRYENGMQLERITEKLVHPDSVERMTYAEDVTAADMFLIRGIMTFRIATARMVAEWIVYYRNRYGEEDCNKLPLLSPEYDVTDPDAGVIPESFVLKIDHRLRKLARKSIVYRMMYAVPPIEGYGSSKATRYREINFYVANTYTFCISQQRFPDSGLSYVGNYCCMPAHRMLGTMHACSVAIRAFMKCGMSAEIFREKGVVYGAKKETYVSDAQIIRTLGEVTWHILIEGFHFQYNESEISRKELGEAYLNRIKKMRDLLKHETYTLAKYNSFQNRYRFLVCTDDWYGLNLFGQMISPYIDIFSGKLFVVSDAALQRTGYNLTKAGVMIVAKTREDGTKSAAFRPIREDDVKQNPWIKP